MSIQQAEAFNPLGALQNKIAVVAVTTSSNPNDMSGTNIWADVQAGRLLLADADGADVYYFWTSESAKTVDETATSGANQAMRIPAGALVPMRPPYITIGEKNSSAGAITNDGVCKFLVVKAPIACKLRLAVVSETPSHRGA